MSWLTPAILPAQDIARDHVDLIELNHVYDEHGVLLFSQLIFFEWSESSRRYEVRAWRSLRVVGQLPQRDWLRKGWRLEWDDGHCLRIVTASSYRETWTQYDVERHEAMQLPRNRRRDLRDIRR